MIYFPEKLSALSMDLLRALGQIPDDDLAQAIAAEVERREQHLERIRLDKEFIVSLVRGVEIVARVEAPDAETAQILAEQDVLYHAMPWGTIPLLPHSDAVETLDVVVRGDAKRWKTKPADQDENKA